eukprot:GFUD01042717.1.p1 GENE.GFUD01042717.1~~GFUD01042717.1.p1  ORF type:complete len:144 (-),score=29.66 GFUD01042717.1:190-573(-)
MFVQCPLCRNPMGLTFPLLQEHLERNHYIFTSAEVLAANMFSNNLAKQDVLIILKEFDEKNAAIQHMERDRIASSHILSQKDVTIRELELMLAATKTKASKRIQDQLKEILELTGRNASLAHEMEIL